MIDYGPITQCRRATRLTQSTCSSVPTAVNPMLPIDRRPRIDVFPGRPAVLPAAILQLGYASSRRSSFPPSSPTERLDALAARER